MIALVRAVKAAGENLTAAQACTFAAIELFMERAEVGGARLRLTDVNAPLIAGNDLRSMDATTRGLLTNPEVIAVDQNWGGVQGDKVADFGDLEIWAKPMSTGGVAVVLLTRGLRGAEIETAPSSAYAAPTRTTSAI